MGWRSININPHGKATGDCTVRAIAIATGQTWDDAFWDLALQGYVMGDMPSSNAVTTAYLRRKGFRRRTIPESCCEDYTVRDFCEDHPRGIFVVGTGSHLVAVIDGGYWDSWDSGRETPVYYFECGEE